MELPAKEAFDILKDKMVTHLHHANTVLTACTFLRRHQLVSRGTMEMLGQAQTAQSSDPQDKKYGLYNDIFLDSVDIHARTQSRNKYGPVLFVLNLDKLAQQDLATIWVTKSNPLYWMDETPISDRWFSSIEDLRTNFVVGRFNQMVVLRSCGGVLPLNECLTSVQVDNPKIDTKKGLSLFEISLGALIVSHAQSGFKGGLPIQYHKCSENCKCITQYAENRDETMKVFFPY